MMVLYTSDGEQPAVMALNKLVANFNENGGWHNRCNETDLINELASRGWYEGDHECGHYLVLNLDKFNLEHKPIRR